jgi:hypothetical protein
MSHESGHTFKHETMDHMERFPPRDDTLERFFAARRVTEGPNPRVDYMGLKRSPRAAKIC